MNRAYGLRPDSIDYDQFRIDDENKTLYWTPGDKKISISTTRGGVRFLALSTLASRYAVGGTDTLRRSLGLSGYTRRGLGSSAVKALQQAEKTLPSNLDNIKLEDLPGIADSARQSAEQVETTIDDQPIDTVWVTQARRELTGLEKAMTGVRDEFANNLAKLTSIDDRKSEVERHVALEHQKLTETDDTETFRRLLHEETTLAEHICTLFREQGITIASIVTTIGMATSTLVLAFTGGGGSAPAPAPKPPDKSGLKEWVKSTYRPLGAPWLI